MQHLPTLLERPSPFTWEDFVALAEDDPRELVDGELMEIDAPTETHEHIVFERASFAGLRIPLAELWVPPEPDELPDEMP